mgnify:CR=1 FL=1
MIAELGTQRKYQRRVADSVVRQVWQAMSNFNWSLDAQVHQTVSSFLTRVDSQEPLAIGTQAQWLVACQQAGFPAPDAPQLAHDVARVWDEPTRSVDGSLASAIAAIRFAKPEEWVRGPKRAPQEGLQEELELWYWWMVCSTDLGTLRHARRFMLRRGLRGQSFVLHGGDPDRSTIAFLIDHATAGTATRRESYDKQPRHALYMLHNSLPWDSQGYATRSHGLIKGLNDMGWTVDAATRISYPFDRHSDLKGVDPLKPTVIDGVTYHRLGKAAPSTNRAFHNEYSRRAISLARQLRPSVLHAASNYWNGLAASAVAKTFDVPFIYEVRGLWEVTARSRNPGYEFTAMSRLAVEMETQAAVLADHVFTLTTALRDEMVRRGVDDLEATLRFQDKVDFRYIGSLLEYEGLDLLIRAARDLADTRDDFRVLIVGSGDAMTSLQSLTSELKLDKHVVFTGRVPHHDVERYYSLVDVAPFPRLALPVCEMVSPLKPFEAMAMEKVTLVSSVAAMAEIVQDGVTGYIFQKNSTENLAAMMTRIIDNQSQLEAVGKTAREWVVNNRTWAHAADEVRRVYESLT